MGAPGLPKIALGWTPGERADADRLASIDVQQEIRQAIVRTLMSEFMYEPATPETESRMHERAVALGARSLKIDMMNDLYGRQGACEECGKSGSYEEYRVKRAAANLPDEAGSDLEWQRMASWSPGSVNITVTV